MRLRTVGFSTNGRGDLVGTVVAYADSGDPLGVEHRGNFSRDAGKALLRKLAEVGVDQEVARAQLTRLLSDLRQRMDAAWQQGPPRQERDRPVVEVSGRPLRDIVDDCWRLLAQANIPTPSFFRLGDALVEVAPEVAPVRPRVVSLATLRLTLDRLADFVSVRGEGPECPARPPKDVLESILAVMYQGLPPLHGVVEAPFLAPGGDVVAEEGYHQETGLYLALGGLRVAPVPERPSPQDVGEARRLLLEELLGDFPFVSPADRAHAIAAVLLPLVRPLISGPTPLHDFEAPLEGTGKGLLAYIIGLLATGHAPPMRTEGRDDDEWRKRLTSALLGTPPILVLDNVRRRVDSAALSAAITAERWTDRLLGHSKDVSVPVRTMWVMTGNNPTYSGEIARRLVRIRLDAGVERPWERTGFRHPDLAEWVQRERSRLVWAALILARAWVAAGRPYGQEVMGGFEAWARVMGGILQVAGIPGFLANRQEVYARAATEGEAWRTLVELWWERFEGARVGVDDLLSLATEHKLLVDLRAGRSDRGARTALGMELVRLRDRIVGRFRIVGAGDDSRTGGARYRLELKSPPEKVTGVTGVTGSSGSETQEPQEPFPAPGHDYDDVMHEKAQRGEEVVEWKL